MDKGDPGKRKTSPNDKLNQPGKSGGRGPYPGTGQNQGDVSYYNKDVTNIIRGVLPHPINGHTGGDDVSQIQHD